MPRLWDRDPLARWAVTTGGCNLQCYGQLYVKWPPLLPAAVSHVILTGIALPVPQDHAKTPTAMTKKKHAARLALQAASDGLSDEIWEGRWDHIASLHNHPIGECVKIIAELERRSPGHTKEEYKDAIARSLFTRR